MSIADVKNTTEHKMQRSLEALKIDLAKVRTGRAHIGLLDHVHVSYTHLDVYKRQVLVRSIWCMTCSKQSRHSRLLATGDAFADQFTLDWTGPRRPFAYENGAASND